MDPAIFARVQMGLSLGFHIIFAAVGMTMPILMTLAERRWLRHGDDVARDLTKAWAKGTAIFFAVGAVSGTILAFELGLLFPEFMLKTGPTIGIAFALEGFAFFAEAIFLGIYLYGWDRVSKPFHLFSGVVIAVSGVLSAVFVTCANAWMNAPGADHPLAVFRSPFVWHEVPHTVLACFVATGLAVAAIHASLLLRKKSDFHRLAMKLALLVALPGIFLQPIIGHFAGEQVAQYQPLKFAAMENLQKTGPQGITSFLATGDFQATLTGLDAFPKEDHPPAIVAWCFRAMVIIGTGLLLLGLLWAWRWKTLETDRRLLKSIVVAGPLGIIAMETGWMVTEIGRQPWIVQGMMRTRDAVAMQTTLPFRVGLFASLYLVLGIVTLQILRGYIRRTESR